MQENQLNAWIFATHSLLSLGGSGGGEYGYDNYGSGDYPEYPDEGGLPKKFDQCYNSYGTQKTIRYAKVCFWNLNNLP